MYLAPEVIRDGRRGRSVDIFPLDCVLLEMATVIMVEAGSLKRLYDFREIDGSWAYLKCPNNLLQRLCCCLLMIWKQTWKEGIWQGGTWKEGDGPYS